MKCYTYALLLINVHVDQRKFFVSIDARKSLFILIHVKHLNLATSLILKKNSLRSFKILSVKLSRSLVIAHFVKIAIVHQSFFSSS